MSKVETRAVGDIQFLMEDGRPRIDARAILFDSWSVDLGGFRERIMPGAVTLDEDLVALFDHDSSMVLGRVSAGTMLVAQDERGVTFTAYPPDTTWANDLSVSMKRGDIRGCSFRMMVDEDDWYVRDGMVYRDVKSARISELTVTSMPAYPETTAAARSLSKVRKSIEERVGRVLSASNENALREALTALQNVLSQLDSVPAEDDAAARSVPTEKVTPMPEKRAIGDGMTPSTPDLVEELTEAFADVVSFGFRAWGAHWNVVGANFSEYHGLFGSIYDDAIGSIDPLAENLRKLGAPAPFQLPQFVELRELQDAAVGTDAIALANDLLQANAVVIDSLADVFETASALNQQGLANYIAERIDSHQKWAWQLTASLGQNITDPSVDPTVNGVDISDVVEEISESAGGAPVMARSSAGAAETKSPKSGFISGFGFIPNRKEK